MENKKYFYRIDILRLIFCLCVVVLHFETFYPIFPGKGIKGFGRAVDFFFILSGFLLMYSFKARRYQSGFEYFGSKVKRLFPLNLLMLFLFSAFTVFPGVFAHFSAAELLKSIYNFFINFIATLPDVFFLQLFIPVVENFIPSRIENIPIWYVSAMVVASFVWYSLLLLASKDEKKSNYGWVLLFPVFIFCYLVNETKQLALSQGPVKLLYLPGGFLRGFADMAIGIFLANYKIEIKSKFAETVFKIALPLLVFAFMNYAMNTVMDFVFIVFTSVLLLFEFSYTPKESKFLTNIGHFCGKASVILYFTHAFVIIFVYTPLFQKYPQIGENFFMSLLVRCGLLTVTGFAVYWLTKPVEKIISNVLAHIKTAE
ncbi:MAG: acyltransferase [Treponemataceae bacterium]|nr:acyltransferase [Treponemataceae bacterium]